MRLAGYRRTSSTTPAAISTTNIYKTPSEGCDKGKKFHKLESIADQSLRLRMEVVKELNSSVDIDIKGIGFVEPEKATTKYKITKSLYMKTTKEVYSKESTKDSGQKTWSDNVYVFKAKQSLVRKSSYLSENKSVFLRKDT